MKDSEIQAGDWIIGTQPGVKDDAVNSIGGVVTQTGDCSYTRRSVYVVEATVSHLVIYDPAIAEDAILPRYEYPHWTLATKAQVVGPIQEQLSEMFEDLRACHEYYCQYNCGTLVERRVGMAHTPRCKSMQERYGFPKYPGAHASTKSDEKGITK